MTAYNRGSRGRTRLTPERPHFRSAVRGYRVRTEIRTAPSGKTIFADNVVPHVLRVDGVLVYHAELAARIDRGELLEPGGEEREIRACAVHACELIAERMSVPPRVLDTWLWNRGQESRYKAIPRHRCRTVYY